MAYNRGGYSRSRRSSTGSGSRWMALRFAGACKVCGARIAAGETAYWDAGARTVTCHAIDCADADGLTTNKPLTGPWDNRTDLRIRAEHRIGAAAPSAPRVIATTFNAAQPCTRTRADAARMHRCCGCCD
jgi:hypothetical protein